MVQVRLGTFQMYLDHSSFLASPRLDCVRYLAPASPVSDVSEGSSGVQRRGGPSDLTATPHLSLLSRSGATATVAATATVPTAPVQRKQPQQVFLSYMRTFQRPPASPASLDTSCNMPWIGYDHDSLSLLVYLALASATRLSHNLSAHDPLC